MPLAELTHAASPVGAGEVLRPEVAALTPREACCCLPAGLLLFTSIFAFLFLNLSATDLYCIKLYSIVLQYFYRIYSTYYKISAVFLVL